MESSEGSSVIRLGDTSPVKRRWVKGKSIMDELLECTIGGDKLLALLDNDPSSLFLLSLFAEFWFPYQCSSMHHFSKLYRFELLVFKSFCFTYFRVLLSLAQDC